MAAYRLQPIRRARYLRGHPDDDMNDDVGLFLVSADDASCTSPTDGVRQLTAAEQAMARLPHVTLPQILYTASVLVTQRNCPVDVVSSILEFAGMFLSFHNETQERVYGRDNMNQEYLRLDLPRRDELALPTGITVSKCIFLAVECTSKDQGWASLDHHLNGTYEGSCTWLEVAVHKPAASAAVSPTDVHASTVGQTETAAESTVTHDEESARNDTRTQDDGDDDNEHENDDGTVEATRMVVFYNVRAHRAFRHHLKCYEDPKGLLHHVDLGDSVRLFLRSQYPGWSNSAKLAKLSAFFSLEFDEEFSFADIPFPARTDADVDANTADELSDGGFACCLQ